MLEGYAADAAGFVLPMLQPGNRVIDVGCGQGALTLSLGTATHPLRVVGVDTDHGEVTAARRAAARASVSTVDFVESDLTNLPFSTASIDVAFSLGLLERHPRPREVIVELSRVLRPGGLLAVSTVDWSKAKLRPKTANVDAALRGRQLLHRRGGGDPFAGRRVAEWVERAGFREVRSRARYRQDIGYKELARKVEAELAAAIQTDDGARDQQLASAARSAWMWVRDGSGDFSQCWVEVLATR
ncbi:methyltransferase domain-containing protein [Saccharomonospora sp. NPDC006951]